MSDHIYTRTVNITAVVLTIPDNGDMDVAVSITDNMKDAIVGAIQGKLQGSNIHREYRIDCTRLDDGMSAVIPRSSLGELHTKSIVPYQEVKCNVSIGINYTIIDNDNVKVDQVYIYHIRR